MVICAKACRFFTTIFLVAVIYPIPQVKCKRDVPEEFIRPDASNQEQTQELVESTEEQLGDLFITQAAGEFQNEADAEDYLNYSSPLQGEHGDYSYLQDDSPQPCCCASGRSKKYSYLIVIGAAILILFCIFACVCHSRAKGGKKSCTPTSSWSCCDRHAKDSSKTCMINLLGPPPDLSDSETDHLYRMPLPLIYDDMGKICNNAEMFIQRCMTSSIKRTYSEPVKNTISSKPLFEEYLKELANLREKQQRESQKRGAVKAFIKELLQATKKATGGKKKEKASRNITDGSTPTGDNQNKNFSKRKSKFTRKNDKDSSSSISITSVLLKPNYQCRYYPSDQSPQTVNGTDQDAVESYRANTNECIEYIPQANGPPRGISDTQAIEDSKKFEMSQDIQTQMDDTEELIRICVNSLRDMYKKYKNIFESLNSQNIDKLQALAGTIAKRMALDKYNYDAYLVPGRENNYMDLEKSNTTTTDSRGLTSNEKLMQEETCEVFDALMKRLFLLIKKRNNLHSEAFSKDHPLLEDLKYATEEEARNKMREKYLELQKEVERLDKSMRKFALDFVFSESSKQIESSEDTLNFSINTNPSLFETSASTIINTEGMCD